MPNTPPITGPHPYNPVTSAPTGTSVPSEARQAAALEFLAERAAGIEWQLVELNEKLFRIVAQLGSPTNP